MIKHKLRTGNRNNDRVWCEGDVQYYALLLGKVICFVFVPYLTLVQSSMCKTFYFVTSAKADPWIGNRPQVTWSKRTGLAFGPFSLRG